METVDQDPLSKLKVDTDELDRKRLGELLEGYCVISKDGKIRPVSDFSLLDSTSKVLAVILAQKAAKALGLATTDQISSGSIESISGIGSTARVKLMRLRQQRVIEGTKGSYSVPNYSIIDISLSRVQNSESKLVVTKRKGRASQTTQPVTEELGKLLKIDQSQIGDKRINLLLSSGKYLERALVVLAIGNELGIDKLTPAEVTKFLREKIGVNVRRENISLALGRGTRYVDRFPSDQKGVYNYRIMAAGDKLLEEVLKR